MPSAHTVLKQVEKRITPSKREQQQTQKVVHSVLQAAEKLTKPFGLSTVLAGSYVRNTWMRDKKEFDVFVLFPEHISREELEKQGLSIGKKIVSQLKGKYVIAYAEHPYVRATINGFEVDIVPCYAVKDAHHIRSAVDRTPFHNRWLSEQLKTKHVADVRLLKQFVKGQKLYGSDTRTQGFSGYLCELLIVQYGTFLNVVREVAHWKPGKVLLDPQGFNQNRKDVVSRHKQNALIVVDPVDKNRNVAAVLSSENFIGFVGACKQFLKEPATGYFFASHSVLDSKALHKKLWARETEFLGIIFPRTNVIDDILYPQLRKTEKRLKTALEQEEFQVLNTLSYANEKSCLIVLEVGVWALPEIRKITGPPIFTEHHANQFLKKYTSSRVTVENNLWVAEVKRTFITAEQLLTDFLSHSPEKLKEMGIASHVAKKIGHKPVVGLSGILSFGKKSPEFLRVFRDFYENDLV